MNSATTYRVNQQIEGQKAEHEAMIEIIKLVPQSLKDEAIKLWVKGTNAASQEAYNRRVMMSDLDEQDFKETQEIVHNAWRKMMGLK